MVSLHINFCSGGDVILIWALTRSLLMFGAAFITKNQNFYRLLFVLPHYTSCTT